MKSQKHNINISRLIVAFVALAVAVTMVFGYAYPNETTTQARPVVKVRGGSANIRQVYRFADVNDTQIVAAQYFGIEPLKSRADLDSSLISQLWKVETSNILKVDSLTHSVPYLTHSAGVLLYTIATNFQARLRAKGLAQYRFIVTSMLRTEDDVRRLMRVNRNAVKKSCHMYATTFDIAYNCFEKVDSLPDFVGNDASHKDLVNALGETLKQLRDSNECYVKFERGQPCFHITTRK